MIEAEAVAKPVEEPDLRRRRLDRNGRRRRRSRRVEGWRRGRLDGRGRGRLDGRGRGRFDRRGRGALDGRCGRFARFGPGVHRVGCFLRWGCHGRGRATDNNQQRAYAAEARRGPFKAFAMCRPRSGKPKREWEVAEHGAGSQNPQDLAQVLCGKAEYLANAGTNQGGKEPCRKLRASGRPTGTAARQRRLAAWLATPAGCRLLAAERPVMRETVRRFHGDSLLWIGPTADLVDTTDQCMVRARICTAPCNLPLNSSAGVQAAAQPTPGVDLVAADPAELPFPSGSLDGVVLHHALDVAADRRATLREAARILKSGGRLAIVGFNPLSLWLLTKPLPAFRDLRPVSVPRLGEWLTVLGLARETRPVYLNYRAALPTALEGGRWQSVSAWVNRVQPPLGGAYILVATKEGTSLPLPRP